MTKAARKLFHELVDAWPSFLVLDLRRAAPIERLERLGFVYVDKKLTGKIFVQLKRSTKRG